MLNPNELVRALRACRGLHNKVVILALDPATTGDPVRLASLAAQVALLRAFGVLMITVCAPGAGTGPLDAQAPALRFVAALAAHDTTGVTLPATSVLKVHRLPPEAVAAMEAAGSAGATPGLVPLPTPVILVHLCSLGYVPILLLPIADQDGEALALEAGVVATLVAGFMDTALLVLAHERRGDAGGPPVIVTDPAAPEHLLNDILLHAPFREMSP